MKAEKLIDKLFELLGEMHEDLLEHKCENVEPYNQQITELFEQSAAVRQTLSEQSKMLMKGMKIDPPPEESSREPLFRVVYSIDVNARDAHQAAENAYIIMSDRTSMLPVLYVMDSKGTEKRVDLAEHRPSRQKHQNE